MSMCGEIENLEREIAMKEADLKEVRKRLEELKAIVERQRHGDLFDDGD